MAALKLIVLVIVMMALAFAGIAIKLILKKDGKFSGTCASNNPYINESGEPCGFCGALPDEQCGKDDDLASLPLKG